MQPKRKKVIGYRIEVHPIKHTPNRFRPPCNLFMPKLPNDIPRSEYERLKYEICRKIDCGACTVVTVFEGDE